ncbi:Mu transposase C-terminal domain-containing protein [Burkholderia vietnamiensis]|uniref:Mu transposase C-terminal domain-containing protein n=1 Tax=Burkholderia vietnamiensis TaxID=60552 RepID=UPI00158863F8|nr:Mu transposase C-terminal domain-containing protein [Burkholderia vietnamiensis]MCA8183798.1 Mu transposase C-terminal domain-containing protein [Burkholderia vietnamiensis]
MNPSVKAYYAAAELASMALPTLPATMQGINQRAKSDQWQFRKRSGRGGGREFAFASLPTDAQNEIRRRVATALITTDSVDAKLPSRTNVQLDLVETDSQRLRADARRGILKTIERLMIQCHVSREAAMTTLLTQAKAGMLDDHLIMMLRAARDERGRKGDGFPSIRTLKRYLGLAKVGALAPKLPHADFTVPAWAKVFLGFYQQPQKPSVELAYREFERAYRMRDRDWEFPTIHQVRRFLGKMGRVAVEAGRMGARELKTIRPFIRRSFDQLLPNDVWSADGHTFDAEVQHPLHGRPFRPEITTIVDIATRRAVGFSIGLAESAIAVLDALRHASTRNGVLAIFYVDRGSGYANAMLQAEGTGITGQLGFEVSHSLPYNSQARGVIERLHQTLWVTGAKTLASYMGAPMDREAKLAHFKVTRSAVKHGGSMPLMGWDAFMQFCNDQIDAYNARPHRSLPMTNDPVNGRRRHMSPDEAFAAFQAKGWQPVMLAADEANRVFRPRVERTVKRGEVQLLNNHYFSGLLEEFHGETVHVGYDIHDAKFVWVYEGATGRFICKAEAGANTAHYMPMSYVEQAREKRADARVQRLQVKLDEVEAERLGQPALTLDTPEVITIPGFGDITRDALNRRFVDAEPVIEVDTTPVRANEPAPVTAEIFDLPETAEQRFARWQALHQHIDTGGIPDKEELQWYGTYVLSKEFAAQKRRAEQAEEWQLASQQ